MLKDRSVCYRAREKVCATVRRGRETSTLWQRHQIRFKPRGSSLSATTQRTTHAVTHTHTHAHIGAHTHTWIMVVLQMCVCVLCICFDITFSWGGYIALTHRIAHSLRSVCMNFPAARFSLSISLSLRT